MGKVAFINSETVLNMPFLFCIESVPDNNRRLLCAPCVCLCTYSYTHTCIETGEKLVRTFSAKRLKILWPSPHISWRNLDSLSLCGQLEGIYTAIKWQKRHSDLLSPHSNSINSALLYFISRKKVFIDLKVSNIYHTLSLSGLLPYRSISKLPTPKWYLTTA